ncbi:MAG: FlgD immunoglobulin-like domain containing protein, partial [Armatimonadota bacterium]
DEAAGRRCAMRTVRQYRCRTGGGPRRFTVTVARGAEGALRITGLASAVARGGRSMTLSFSLTRSAATTVGIYNVAGRQVRRLTRAEALPRGINNVTWDLRANTGTPAPSGVYLCRVQSRSEDGQSANAVAMVHVGR